MEHTRKNHNENGASIFTKMVSSLTVKRYYLLLGHLGSAGIGLDLKATGQERNKRLCLPSGLSFSPGV